MGLTASEGGITEGLDRLVEWNILDVALVWLGILLTRDKKIASLITFRYKTSKK